MLRQLLIILLICIAGSKAPAHEIWLEVNTPVVKVGEVVHIASKLGNCGNGHRDFKTSGIIDPKWTTLHVLNSQHKQTSLLDEVTNTAAASTEGFWTVRHTPGAAGLHWIVQSLDQVVEHGGSVMRGVLTAKTLFIAAQDLEDVAVPSAADAVGLPIELKAEPFQIWAISRSNLRQPNASTQFDFREARSGPCEGSGEVYPENTPRGLIAYHSKHDPHTFFTSLLVRS